MVRGRVVCSSGGAWHPKMVCLVAPKILDARLVAKIPFTMLIGWVRCSHGVTGIKLINGEATWWGAPTGLIECLS